MHTTYTNVLLHLKTIIPPKFEPCLCVDVDRFPPSDGVCVIRLNQTVRTCKIFATNLLNRLNM